jgi:hypothetical protein
MNTLIMAVDVAGEARTLTLDVARDRLVARRKPLEEGATTPGRPNFPQLRAIAAHLGVSPAQAHRMVTGLRSLAAELREHTWPMPPAA